MNAQSGPWQGKGTVPCTASGSLLFVGDGAVEQAARLPGVSGLHPCVAFRINTLPKAGSKHTFTQGSSSQEGTRGTPCPSAGNSKEGQGLVHQPHITASSHGMSPRLKPARWGVGCWLVGGHSGGCLPLTGQQSWPRVQGRGEGPAGLGAGRLTVFKIVVCQASWDLSEGVRANEGGVYNRRGCLSDSGGETVDARGEWCVSTEQGVTESQDPWPLGLDLSCD